MLNLLRTKVVPPKITLCNTKPHVQRWRLRNLHSSPLKPSVINNTDRRFVNKNVFLHSFCNNNKLTKLHLFGQSFYRQQHHQVPEKYKKYSTVVSDEDELEAAAKQDWGPNYSDEVINEIDRRRKMKWIKHVPKGIPKKEEEIVPPELHRIIPPIPLGGEYRYESKWQWPRKIYEMEQQDKEFMAKGREYVRWEKKWRDRWKKIHIRQWIYDNARWPAIFLTRWRTFWFFFILAVMWWIWDFRKRTGYYLGKEWERYIKHVLDNPMRAPPPEEAAQRLQKIRTDEMIHRFASQANQVLPIIEIHTSRYNEPTEVGDRREEDHIKIHVNQRPFDPEVTLDLFTDQLGEWKLTQIPPEQKPKPEGRKYPLTKLPRPDLETIPEVPKEHLEEHTVKHPVVSEETPTFFVGMFDQHNTRYAQDFVSNQLIEYIKWLLSWKLDQQTENDWITNYVKSKLDYNPEQVPENIYRDDLLDGLIDMSSKLTGWPLEKWNKDDPDLREIVKDISGEHDAPPERIDHIILKLRNIYDISRAIPAAFMKAFVAADHDFMMESWLNPHHFQHGFSGACAAVAMFFNRWLFVGSVGDYRTFVVKRSFDEPRESFFWSYQSASFPVTILLDAEIGTRTHQHTVQHGLLVDQKGFGFGPRKLHQWKEAAGTEDVLDTTAEPHLNHYKLTPDDALVVMVSPGVLNVMKISEITDMLTKKLDAIAMGTDKPENAASMIVYAAAARSKELIDPLSATVVFLNPRYHEQVEPIYTIPQQYDVQIPQKRFEYHEAWADTRQVSYQPLMSIGARLGTQTEEFSNEFLERLSKRWNMQIKPLLPSLEGVRNLRAEIKNAVKRVWADVNPEEQIHEAIDFSKGYVYDYMQQHIDDNYYLWLKRSLGEEFYPSPYHVQQFIDAARERAQKYKERAEKDPKFAEQIQKDLALADNMEHDLNERIYSRITEQRMMAFWRRREPPKYPPELIAYFKKKGRDIELKTLSQQELIDRRRQMILDMKRERKAKDTARKQLDTKKEDAKKAKQEQREAAKKKRAEEKEAREREAQELEEGVEGGIEGMEIKEEKPTEKEPEAAKGQNAKVMEEIMRIEQSQEQHKELMKGPSEKDYVEQLYQADSKSRNYQDPHFITQTTLAEKLMSPEEKETLPWQERLRPQIYVVDPETHYDYQYVTFADTILATIDAMNETTPPASEVARLVVRMQLGKDLSTPAQRQAFFAPYSNEVLEEVISRERRPPGQEATSPAKLELQRRNPPRRRRQQQRKQREQKEEEQEL